MSHQGGIQADTNKADPAWIHSGEPGTSGREPFEEDGLNAPGAQHHERQHQGFSDNIQTGNNQSGLGSSGASGLLGGSTTGEHHHHQHHQHDQHVSNETLGRSGVTGESHSHSHTGALGAGGLTSGLTGGQTHSQGQSHGNFKNFDDKPSFGDNVERSGNYNEHGDRVGNFNEGGAAYERTGAGGPITGGAAGTDRFDTDKHRDQQHRDIGDRAIDRAAGEGNNNNTDSRAGGLLSGITTTDNEFTGKDRSHTGPNVPSSMGAYEDTSADFKNNTSGPGGNTALTGREGTTSKNPVAQATHTGAGAGEPTGRVGQTEHAQAEGTEHKGLMQKIKDMI